MCRVGQSRIYTPYMTIYLVMSLPNIPCIHRVYMVLSNPTNAPYFVLTVPDVFAIQMLLMSLQATHASSLAPSAPF